MLGDLSSLLVQDPCSILCHCSSSETNSRQVWSEADHKTGSQALSEYFCGVGEEVHAVVTRSLSAGVRRCFWWVNTLEVQFGCSAGRG